MSRKKRKGKPPRPGAWREAMPAVLKMVCRSCGHTADIRESSVQLAWASRNAPLSCRKCPSGTLFKVKA